MLACKEFLHCGWQCCESGNSFLDPELSVSYPDPARMKGQVNSRRADQLALVIVCLSDFYFKSRLCKVFLEFPNMLK